MRRRCISSGSFFAIGTDPEHLHAITAWRGDRTPEQVQRAMKSSVTQALNHAFGRCHWFSRNGHKRRVRGREHFVYLRNEYVPSHRGWKWDRLRGWFR